MVRRNVTSLKYRFPLSRGFLKKSCILFIGAKGRSSHLVRPVLGTSRLLLCCRGARGTRVEDVNNWRCNTVVYATREYSFFSGAPTAAVPDIYTPRAGGMLIIFF